MGSNDPNSNGYKPRVNVSAEAKKLGATLASDLEVQVTQQSDIFIVTMTGSVDMAILQRVGKDGRPEFISEAIQAPQDNLQDAVSRGLRNAANKAVSAWYLAANPRPTKKDASARAAEAEARANAAAAEAEAARLKIVEQAERLAALEAQIAALTSGDAKGKKPALKAV